MNGALPAAPHPILGRDWDLRRAEELLLRADVPLVGVTGVGGGGKTRFAIALAEAVAPRFADGVIFVSLEDLAAPEDVASAIAVAVDAGSTDLTTSLRDSRCLLVLDPVDRVLDAVSLMLAGLMAECPHLKLLVTSRIVPHIQYGWHFDLDPLPVPELDRLLERLSAEQVAPLLARQPAVALLVERALDLRPDLAVTPANMSTLAAICTRLDGLPLALELAARQLDRLSPEELLERLPTRTEALPELLTTLKGSASTIPPRHGSLAACVDWSFDLLTGAERLTCGLLAGWEGSFDLETVESLLAETTLPAETTMRAATASASNLSPPSAPANAAVLPRDALEFVATLLNHSLLAPFPAADSAPRWKMWRTVRAYALDRLLAEGGSEAVRSLDAVVRRSTARGPEASLVVRGGPFALDGSAGATAAESDVPSADADAHADAHADASGLSPKERDVAILLAEGLTYREIAARLVVSVKTVEKHVRNILLKSGLTNRTQVAFWVRREGWAAEGGANVAQDDALDDVLGGGPE